MVASIILTRDFVYVSDEGKLPSRKGVDFDKDLLTNLVRGNVVSKKGYAMLPPSIKENVFNTSGSVVQPQFPVTIPEIAAVSDILLVVRSSELGGGDSKVFRFDNFKLMLKQRDIELWERI